MKLTFKQFVSESLEDKGAFKAIFVVGIPGAGKSYTISKLHGTVSPRIINTDRALEFLSKKFNKPANSETWSLFRDSALRITSGSLQSYLDGVLPLFIDGTSNNTSNILSRAGILESLGYDVGMVFVTAPLEVAIKRAEERAKKIGRAVDEDFIRQVHEQAEENKEYFKGKFHFFKEVNNSEDALTDEVLNKVFKSVQSFYNQPIENPVGKRLKEKMIDMKVKTLVPEMFSKEALKKKVDGWYRE